MVDSGLTGVIHPEEEEKKEEEGAPTWCNGLCSVRLQCQADGLVQDQALDLHTVQLQTQTCI